MSHQLRCVYCGGTDGRRCTTTSPSAAGRYVTECKSCGRILEEHHCDVQELFVERAQDIPFCVVTPDFSDNNEHYRTPPLEDDPFESIGFITAFSTWSLELSPLFATTTSSFSGYLAELERALLDPLYTTSDPVAATSTEPPQGGSASLVDNLRAYFQIVEVASLLGLDRDIIDHAVQLFRDCSSVAYMRNRNIEALATATLVQASREVKEVRTLQEISVAAGVPQKEIHRYMKILTDSLKLSQPINSNSISVYMPRFCSVLELEKSTQDLATHIGEVVMDKSFCTRRNPISISAAAIYLSCQLEDKRKTQTEICKATALTEVTLRKVYKELLENLNDLLPANYTPAVPPDKAFPGVGLGLNRGCAIRASAPSGLASHMPVHTETSTPEAGMTSGGTSSAMTPSSGNLIRGSASSVPAHIMPSSGNLIHGSASSVPACIMPSSFARKISSSTIGAGTSSTGADSRSIGVKEQIQKTLKEEGEKAFLEANSVVSAKLGPSKGVPYGDPFNPFRLYYSDVAHSLPRALYGASVQLDETMSLTREDQATQGVQSEDKLSLIDSNPVEAASVTVTNPFQPMISLSVDRDLHNTQDWNKAKLQESLGFDRQNNVSKPASSQCGPFGNVYGTATTMPSSISASSALPQKMWDFSLSQRLLAQCAGLFQGLQETESRTGSKREVQGGFKTDDILHQYHRDASMEPEGQLPTGLGTSSWASQPTILQEASWQPAFLPTNLCSSEPGDTSVRMLDGADGNGSGSLLVKYLHSGLCTNLLPTQNAGLMSNLNVGLNSEMQSSLSVNNRHVSKKYEK